MDAAANHGNSKRYFAFLSYSHVDAAAAAALARFVETFRVPVRLGGEEQKDLPKRMFPIFRDRDELSASSDLGAVIRNALSDSRVLIVLCSPEAAQSNWVNEEIRTFRRLGDPDRIYAIVLRGEPHEAFPKALTETGVEPLAIDFRPHVDNPRDARLRLAAALLGVNFDALKQRDLRRRRVQKMQLAAVAVAFLVAIGFGVRQWESSQYAQTVAEANRLADLSAQKADNDALGMVLSTEAFGMAATPRTASALLRNLLSFEFLQEAAVPRFSNVTFADRGRLLAITTATQSDTPHVEAETSDLIVMSARNLRAFSRTPLHLPATYACGFTSAPRVAVGAGKNVQIFEVNGNAVRLVQAFSVGDISALSCIPGSSEFTVGHDSGTIDVFRVGSSKPVAAARVFEGAPLGIAISPAGNMLAAQVGKDALDERSSRGIQLFDLPSLRAVGYTQMHDGNAYCVGQTCSTGIAFGPDGSTIAWCDGGVQVASVHRLDAPKSYSLAGLAFGSSCDDSTLIYDAGMAAPTVLKPRELYRYDHAKQTYAQHVFHKVWTGSLDWPPPAYDASLAEFVQPSFEGLGVMSLTPMAAPMLGSQKASQWPGGFALSGSSLIIPGQFTTHVYDLAKYRTQSGESGDTSSAVLLHDAGDGLHAVSFNYNTSEVQVLSIRSKPRILNSFRVAGGAEIRKRTRPVQIAFDPGSGIVTIADPDGIERFSTVGKPLSRTRWSAPRASKGFKDCKPQGLSARGNYVTCGGYAQTVFRSDGQSLSGDFDVRAISSDERIAFGRMFSDNQTQANEYMAAYLLPSLQPVLGLYIPAGTTLAGEEQPTAAMPLALSPDGRMLAYIDDGGAIQLFAFRSNVSIGPPLRKPPDWSSYRDLSFSADGRYLVVDYTTKSRSQELAIYSVDPNQWQRSLCLRIGRLTTGQIEALGTSLHYRNACSRWQVET